MTNEGSHDVFTLQDFMIYVLFGTLTVAGEYDLEVELDGVRIADGRQFPITVAPETVDPTTSTTFGAGLNGRYCLF